MRVPDEFTHLVQRFYQGSDAEISTMEEWVALALRGLDPKQQAVIKHFLFARNPSDAKLQRIWQDTGANYYFDDIRGVLTLIHDTIVSS